MDELYDAAVTTTKLASYNIVIENNYGKFCESQLVLE